MMKDARFGPAVRKFGTATLQTAGLAPGSEPGRVGARHGVAGRAIPFVAAHRKGERRQAAPPPE